VARRRSLAHRLLDAVEAAVLHGFFVLARTVPVDAASGAGGWIARTIGPWLPVSNTGRRNLRRAFPELGQAEVEGILRGVWDNLGRTVAEYPHLQRIWDFDPERPTANGRIAVAGVEQFVALRDDGKPAIIFSAHLGNWELLPLAAARHELPLAVLFRPPNNPHAAALVKRIRAEAHGRKGGLLPSGVEGALAAIEVLDQGTHLGMLVDQRFRRGVLVPFFGRPAQTATVLAKLARRFDCPVHGARVERLGGARFRLSLTPPLELPRTGDADADIGETMRRVTAIIEGWVRERPEQWLWLHRRWKD
jgi:KDO2-lipid IV(A) lauroyltransferase